MDDDSVSNEQVHSSDDEDIRNDDIPKVKLKHDWWNPLSEEDKPATPEPAWSIPSSNLPVATHNWASALASTYAPPPENSLLAQTDDMATFMNWKFKEKDIVDPVSNVTTIAPGMYKLDPVILAPKVKNNREAHEYYLKHTMEQAAILRERIKAFKQYKNDRILRTPSSNEKNKVEVQSRKVKSSLNKRNSDSKNVCNEHVKYPVKGAKALCFVCNECLFDANHAMCLIDHVNSMHVRAKFVSKKNKKRKEWKPTGKVFNSIGYKWKPTGRTFTLVGNAFPLTRLIATKKVPLRVPIPLEVVAPKHVVTRVYTRRPKVPKFVQNSKPKVVQIVLWYLDSGCSKHMTKDGSQLTNFVHKFLDLEVAFRKHTCFVCNLEGVDLLSGCRGTNLYSLSIGDMMASSPICLFCQKPQRLSHGYGIF
ncbi:hypothetical protein Tco_0513884, partial [Tanacetum coccineum]